MTRASRFLARLLELPPADTHDVTVERDLEVPMPDGTRLLADRYAPPQWRQASDDPRALAL